MIIVVNTLLVLAGLMFAGGATEGPQNALPIWGGMFMVLAFVVVIGWVKRVNGSLW